METGAIARTSGAGFPGGEPDERALTSPATIEVELNLLYAVMSAAGRAHLVYLDRDFNFVCVNETYAETCGYRPEEMVGKNHFALYPHEENEAIFAQVRDTGVPAEYRDKPFVFPDQPERGVTYWDWTLKPVKNASGEVEGLVFSLVDTTDRKRAELALQENERKYSLLFAKAAMAAALTKLPEGVFVDVNEAFETIFGYTRQEVVGKTSLELGIALPEERSRTVAELAKQSSLREEKQICTKSGEVRVISSNVSELELGRQKYALTTIQDITERKRAEQALQESEKRFRHVAEGIPQVVWMVDSDMEAVWVSPRYVEYVGAALAPKKHTEVVHPEDREQVLAAWEEVKRQGDALESQYRVRRQDGEYRWFLTRTIRTRDADGRELWLATGTDIDDLIRAREELERAWPAWSKPST